MSPGCSFPSLDYIPGINKMNIKYFIVKTATIFISNTQIRVYIYFHMVASGLGNDNVHLNLIGMYSTYICHESDSGDPDLFIDR